MQNLSELSCPRWATKYLLLALVSLVGGHSDAASFDCGKAKTTAEKLVCSTPELSQLDEELAASYSEAIKSAVKRTQVIAGQRKWVIEIRDKCTDVACLSDAYKARIGSLRIATNEMQRSCPTTASGIIGNWRRLTGGDFEEFALRETNGARTFSSWLHHNPEYMGTWAVNNCVLHVANDQNSVLNFDYKIHGLKGDVLYLENLEDGESSSYRRVKR